MSRSKLDITHKIAGIIGLFVAITFGVITCQNSKGNDSGIEVRDNEAGNIVIGDDNDITNTNIYNNRKTITKNKIIGKWKANENWTKYVIANEQIISDVQFSSDMTFNCNAVFITGGFKHFNISYKGKWRLEDDMLLFEEFTIDDITNYEQAGKNEQLSAMMAIKYFNAEIGGKIETIKSISENIIRTEWKLDGTIIEKIYKKI